MVSACRGTMQGHCSLCLRELGEVGAPSWGHRHDRARATCLLLQARQLCGEAAAVPEMSVLLPSCAFAGLVL